MKNFIFFTVFMFSGFTFLSAQTPAETTAEANRITRQKQESTRRFEAMRGNGRNTGFNSARSPALQIIKNIYRKPTAEELELLAPDNEDLTKYAGFLRQSDAGLIKLIADRGCATSTKVLNVSADCLKYTMPGAGSSYSFRKENYRVRHLADLTYTADSFQSPGILAHALFVNVGDIPLEQISLQTRGLKFLNDFQTVTDFDEALELDRRLIEGIRDDGFIYRRGLYARENTTFVLRSIAYRGSYYRAVLGFNYDELEFDKRKDVTVAFRIVRRNEESVTIIWKQLAEKDSPKIKPKEKESSDTN